MTDLVRQEIVASADTLVLKVGTRVLADERGQLDLARIAALAEEVAVAVEDGRRVVLVSSGAVGAGMGRLGIPARPGDLAQLQAVAALGQSRLIEVYNRALEPHGLHAAQILLTLDDLDDRTRYLNVRNTILALFRYGAIPVINENDTVSVDELQISFGDNDRLAALVTNLIRAPLLVLLSDVDGLFDRPPTDPEARLVPTVTDCPGAIRNLKHQQESEATLAKAKLGTGGMASKLAAAKLATAAGENVIIANGHGERVLGRILAGEPVGTLILAEGASIQSRKRWIAYTARPRGAVHVDEGAHRAVATQGRSLLAVGILQVEGDFQKGDLVGLYDTARAEFARGLINYSAEETRRIAGRPTGQIADILGHRPYDEVIHRDNLALSR